MERHKETSRPVDNGDGDVFRNRPTTEPIVNIHDCENIQDDIHSDFSKRLSLSDDTEVKTPSKQDVRTGVTDTIGTTQNIMSSPGTKNVGAERDGLQPQLQPQLNYKPANSIHVNVHKVIEHHLRESTKEGADSCDTASTSTVTIKEIADQFCCQCGEKFEKSVQLAAHRRWSCSLKESKAKCEDCNTWFASDQGLRRHVRQVHGGSLKCQACGARFKNNIQLTRHWLDEHYEDKGDSSFKCFECGSESFQSKYDLECHWLRHKYDKRQQRQMQEKIQCNSHLPSDASHNATPQEMTSDNPPTSQSSHFFTTFSPMSHPRHTFEPPQPPPTDPNFDPTSNFHRPPHFPFFHQRLPHFPACIPIPPPPPFIPPPPFFRPPPPPPPYMPPCFPTPRYNSSENNAQTSNTPRHDHAYVEPTSTLHAGNWHSHGFKHIPHHQKPFCHKGKRKLKKYLMLMMKGQVPHLWSHEARAHILAATLRENDGEIPTDSNVSSMGEGESLNSDNGDFQIACKFCDKVIKRKWISWHQRKDCPVLSIHKCGVCDRVFRKRHMLLKHMQESNHTKFSSFRNENPHDQVDSETLLGLQKKMNEALSFKKCNDTNETVQFDDTDPQMDVAGPDCKIPSRQPLINSNVKNAAETILKCSVCSLQLLSEGGMKIHLQEHIDQVLTVRKVWDWTVRSADYFHMGDPEDGTWSEVAESERTSTTGSAFTGDSTIFSGLPPSSASIDSTWLKPHKKRFSSHHSSRGRKGEISVCDFCGDQFSFRKDLEKHIKEKHEGSKLRCPVCNKSFSWKKRGKFFERHMESHFGVKIFKYKCDHCGKTFLERAKMQAHVAAMHTHDLSYKCTSCGKAYANKSSLVRHERKHTGAHPHKCNTCSKTFLEKRELVRHMSTHTGVAPFSCEVCGQGFTLRTSLTTHKKNKHPTPVDT